MLRHILKHLRQRRLLSPYEDILNRSGLCVEHPTVTKLHDAIILKGDWNEAENLLEQMSQAGLFDNYLRSSQPHSNWKRLHGKDSDETVPSPRGGHSLCIDTQNGMIYLYGGWDGEKNVGDFWRYDIKNAGWRLLDQDPNGPGELSCHKMTFDSKTGTLFLLGGLSDKHGFKPRLSGEDMSTTSSNGSEFYCYHTRGDREGKWEHLSSNTAVRCLLNERRLMLILHRPQADLPLFTIIK
jgi:muskelin